MARAIESLVTQSLLDRLSQGDEPPSTRAHSLRVFKDSIKRDMEWLLNTRQPPIPDIMKYAKASTSVVHYGLIDTSSLSLSSSTDHRKLQQAVHDCIASFEPRLKDVNVVIDGEAGQRRQVRFHIEAQIRLDPAPEEISFDTVLDLTSGEYKVN